MHAIKLGAHCTLGVMFNWCTFLLNEFLDECKLMQEKGKEFHCSWLHLAIMLDATPTPAEPEFPELGVEECTAARFSSLWFSKDRERQESSSYIFFLHYRGLLEVIK